MCERENLVFDYLIYLEPVERFKTRVGMIVGRDESYTWSETEMRGEREWD